MAPSILSMRMRTGIPVGSTVSCRKGTWIWMIEGVQPAPGWVNSAEPMTARGAPRRGPSFFSAVPREVASWYLFRGGLKVSPRCRQHANQTLSQGLFSNGLLTEKLLRHHRGEIGRAHV